MSWQRARGACYQRMRRLRQRLLDAVGDMVRDGELPPERGARLALAIREIFTKRPGARRARESGRAAAASGQTD